MKCNEAEKLILLNDSSESAARHNDALADHLYACESCRQLQLVLEDSGRLFAAADEPSVKSIQNILRQARLNAPERKHIRIPGLKPALAMAASVVIVLGFFLSNITPDKVGMIYTVTETLLLDADDQIVSVMYEGLSEDDLAFNFLMTYEDNG